MKNIPFLSLLALLGNALATQVTILGINDIDNVKLAQIFPEADAIIGGHSHTRVEKEHVINGVLVTQTENKVKYLTKLIFDVDCAKCMMQYLDGKAKIDYSDITRIELNICK